MSFELIFSSAEGGDLPNGPLADYDQTMTQLGQFQLSTVSGGRLRLDGGTMFGVVPKPIWSRVMPSDEQNRIAQATNCLLVRSPQHTVLIDTGYGSKLTDKQRKIYDSEVGDPLADSLVAQGVSVDDIDTVIFTHLHFDHAGGATRYNAEGDLISTFPNAEYVVQRREWDIATAELPELRGAYPLENFASLEGTGQLRLIEGDTEIVPGMHSLVTGGHTMGHQSILIEDAGQTAVYLADLCPSLHHLPTLWCMAYDVDLLAVRRNKHELLGRIADGEWLAMVDHDPDHAAATIERDSRADFKVREAYSVL